MREQSGNPNLASLNSRVTRTFCEPMDRRRQKRYELEAPVSFFWKDAGGNRRRGHGFLRDVSEKGVFVWTHESPPLGTKVQFEILFKSAISASGLRMQARGEIVRVERSQQVEQGGGFAASTKTLRMHSNKVDVVQEHRKETNALDIAGGQEEK